MYIPSENGVGLQQEMSSNCISSKGKHRPIYFVLPPGFKLFLFAWQPSSENAWLPFRRSDFALKILSAYVLVVRNQTADMKSGPVRAEVIHPEDSH